MDLPIDMVEQQSDLIDHVFAFAFNALGLFTVELRIRPLMDKHSWVEKEELGGNTYDNS